MHNKETKALFFSPFLRFVCFINMAHSKNLIYQYKALECPDTKQFIYVKCDKCILVTKAPG